MTTLTQPPGSPCAADWSQCGRRGGAGISLCAPGLPPGAHCPHRGSPAEGRGGRSLKDSSGLMGLSGPGGLDYLVLNHLGAAPAGTRARSAQATRWLMQVNFLSYMQLTSSALPSLTDSKGSLVVVSSLLGRVPPSFSSPYSAAKFALGSFFGSLRRELDVQDVNVAITMCVLGLRDRASAAEGVRGVTRAKAAPGPKAALAVIRGSATRASGVFYPWRFHLLGLLRGWMPQPRAWFIRQELNITTPAAA
ncbi:hydroxysteroid 11-beta-dehydrogenase 1-like protein isoform X10 [Physeter macrocephalus]|uniref:Hydroxysteroid 11-beta-dehydrogenase 1-like protein n=1 Tax=Physeter macrocephalus TaxID=9755 RepID=A0A455C7W3_PHYMC|nr:hydroxysteroid 11-beta-dehydrogenase 1-like protein isoform X10 [Physeter catodon]|eukprot:XP_028355963.1 hydroxysteroid 11-beta-dehydrogenase 1-like protein isoform X6 [Physeter catodon]